MTKVGIADFKARLSEHLRAVRSGRTLTVLDRDTPIAQVIPFGPEPPLRIRPATRRPSQLKTRAAPRRRVNSLRALLEDRARR
ncbi:MAG TPA: prevent-host-death protein [Vicinamibacteria bacterium]|nr:prevent-host-death protein [Vicinamibacteria bacterium]